MNAKPFIGEIRMFAGTNPPPGWAFCNGVSIPVSENELLFTLIGTTYGGDDQNFRLPDLRGRVPVHHGNGLNLGESGGVEAVTLNKHQLPTHYHLLMGSTDPASRSTVGDSALASTAAAGTASAYSSDGPFRPLDPSSVAPTGGGAAHSNLQPFVCVSFIIALEGASPVEAEEQS